VFQGRLIKIDLVQIGLGYELDVTVDGAGDHFSTATCTIHVKRHLELVSVVMS
jgi:hypothetical protein